MNGSPVRPRMKGFRFGIRALSWPLFLLLSREWPFRSRPAWMAFQCQWARQHTEQIAELSSDHQNPAWLFFLATNSEALGTQHTNACLSDLFYVFLEFTPVNQKQWELVVETASPEHVEKWEEMRTREGHPQCRSPAVEDKSEAKEPPVGLGNWSSLFGKKRTRESRLWAHHPGRPTSCVPGAQLFPTRHMDPLQSFFSHGNACLPWQILINATPSWAVCNHRKQY